MSTTDAENTPVESQDAVAGATVTEQDEQDATTEDATTEQDTGAEDEGVEDEDETVETPETDLSTTDGIAMALAQYGDASIAEQDLPVVVEIEAEIQKDAGSLANTAGKMLKLRRSLARKACKLMPHVLLVSGLPDWDGTSKGFHLLFDDVIESALVGIGTTKDDKIGKQEIKNLKNSIRGHIKRTYLLPAIRNYVWETSEAVRDSMPGGRRKDGNFVDSESALFVHLVGNEYRRCDITPPRQYKTPEEIANEDGNGAGPGEAIPDPAQLLRRSVEGAGTMGPQYHAAMLLQLATSLAERVTDQKNPPKAFGEDAQTLAKDYAMRVSTIALYVVRYLDGDKNVNDPVTDGITEEYWSEKDAEVLA